MNPFSNHRSAIHRPTVSRRAVLAGIGASALAAGRATAQAAYPSRPIRLVVPYPPGGVVDAMARQWGERIKGPLGTVVIENLAGAAGTIGAGNVARAEPDGYTLLFGDSSSQIIAPSLMANPPYNAAADFAAVSIVATSSTALVVNPKVPVQTFAEFIAYANKSGDKLSYASAGQGTVTNVAGELFKQLIKVPGIVHVPYRGAGPGLTDLIGGTVPMMTPNVTAQVLDMHRTGKVRILAVFAPARLKAAPEIPAAVETLPGLVVQLAAGLFAPAKTPRPIIEKIADGTALVVKDPAFVKVLEAAGLEARADASSAAGEAFLDAERRRLVPIIEAAGLKQK